MQLTDQERTTLEIFTSDAGAFEIVHKIALKKLETERDNYVKNALLPSNKESNEEIGARIKALGEGIRLVEAIFREIGNLKKHETKEEKNPAR